MNEIDLTELNVPGFIRFSIKAEDTQENQEVHNWFKDFAHEETSNNYTKAIARLRELAMGDFKISMLYDIVENLEQKIKQLEEKLEANKKVEVTDEKEGGMF